MYAMACVQSVRCTHLYALYARQFCIAITNKYGDWYFGVGFLVPLPLAVREALTRPPSLSGITLARRGTIAGTMLALTDAALAHLCIAASAVPPHKRARWLARLAATVDPPRKLVNQRARTLRKRARRRAGVRVYHLELSNRAVEGMITALIANGRLTAAEAQDQRQLERALARWLVEYGQHWTP